MFFMARGYAFALLWLGIMMYFMIGWADYGNARMIFTDKVIAEALLFALAASVLLFVVFCGASITLARVVGVAPGIPPVGAAGPSIEQAGRYLKWLAIPLLIAIPTTLLLVFGGEAFQQSWEERRLAQSKFAILPVLLAQALAIFPGFFWAAGHRLWSIAFLIIAIWLSAVLGARLTAVIALSSLYVALQFRHGDRRWIRLLPLFALPAALALHVGLRLTRGIDAQALVTAMFDGTIGALLSAAAEQGIDVFGGERTPFRGFYYVVEHEVWGGFPSVFQTIQRIIFVLLPHEISQKPTDVVDLLWQASVHDGYMAYLVSSDWSSDAEKFDMLLRLVAQGSLHCTLWGEILANGGYMAAVIVCVFLGLLFAIQEILIARTPVLCRFGLTALVIGQFFYVARGNTVIGFTHFLLVGVLWFAVVITVNYLRRGRITVS